MAKRFIAALISAALLSPWSVAARPVARKHSGPSKVAERPDPSAALATQIVVNAYDPALNLADQCRRANFKNLALAMDMNSAMLTSNKSEFETASSFEMRASHLSAIMAKEQTVICQPLNDNPDITFTYDADKQAFNGSFSPHQNVWRDTKSLGQYKTKTRMGIPVTVKSSIEFNYNVDFDLGQDVEGCVNGTYAYTFAAPIAAQDAPFAKASGFAVYLGRLHAPYISVEEISGTPTLDDPYDVYEKRWDVKVKLEELLLVDGAGKVFWRCKIGSDYPSQPPRPKGDPAEWVKSYDYPVMASINHRTGVVGYEMTVSTKGEPIVCNIVSSSGFQDLDQQTCATLMRRARFLAATDEAGTRIQGTYKGVVDWRPFRDF